MAKIQTGISIDEKLAEQAKAVGKQHRWGDNFSLIVEMGLELFIQKYSQPQLPGIAAPETQKVTR